MTATDVVDLLIRHYKENLAGAETVYEDLCFVGGAAQIPTTEQRNRVDLSSEVRVPFQV